MKPSAIYNHPNLSADKLASLAFELFAACICEPLELRIIVELGETAGDQYYMVDFSNYGEPFADDTLVYVTAGGEKWPDRGWAYNFRQSFNNYFFACAYVASLLSKGFVKAYVEGY